VVDPPDYLKAHHVAGRIPADGHAEPVGRLPPGRWPPLAPDDAIVTAEEARKMVERMASNRTGTPRSTSGFASPMASAFSAMVTLCRVPGGVRWGAAPGTQRHVSLRSQGLQGLP
jgi:hypothetical protein